MMFNLINLIMNNIESFIEFYNYFSLLNAGRSILLNEFEPATTTENCIVLTSNSKRRAIHSAPLKLKKKNR